jgi:hypothetical protein
MRVLKNGCFIKRSALLDNYRVMENEISEMVVSAE